MEKITGKVVLAHGELLEYEAIQVFTEGSYVLNVRGDFPITDRTSLVIDLKERVSEHVTDLHDIKISAITGTT